VFPFETAARRIVSMMAADPEECAWAHAEVLIFVVEAQLELLPQ